MKTAKPGPGLTTLRFTISASVGLALHYIQLFIYDQFTHKNRMVLKCAFPEFPEPRHGNETTRCI